MRKVLATAVAVMLFSVGGAGAQDYVAPEDFPVAGAYTAMAAGDIDAAVGYFAEDAVMVIVPVMDEAPPPWADKEALVGREEIGAWLSYLAADNSSMDIFDLEMTEHRAMFAGYFNGDHFRELGMESIPSEGAAIIVDGLIQGLMWY